MLAWLAQKCRDGGVFGDELRDYPVHPRCARALVPAHPVPGNRQEIRVRDEVEQIINSAAGICGRPTVQLGLHPQYPPLGLIQLR
jgi:hypothetical protein